MILLAEMAQRAEDPELGRLFGALSESLTGEGSARLMATRLAQGDEQHMVVHVGPLATWLGKSRQTWMSAFFGTPNPVRSPGRTGWMPVWRGRFNAFLLA
ncbi:hypothetical protein [Aeromonas rivipollensis]|uniref:hypothetical protein n=1 Tax=Aeromonas rivipollensis TaxID=948519 RepID=UPI003D19BA3E